MNIVPQSIQFHLVDIHKLDFIEIYDRISPANTRVTEWFQGASAEQLSEAIVKQLRDSAKNELAVNVKLQVEREVFEKLVFFKMHILRELDRTLAELKKEKKIDSHSAMNISRYIQSEICLIVKDRVRIRSSMSVVSSAEIVTLWETDKQTLVGMVKDRKLKIGGLEGLYLYLVGKHGSTKAAMDALVSEFDSRGFPLNARSFSALMSRARKHMKRQKIINKS